MKTRIVFLEGKDLIYMGIYYKNSFLLVYIKDKLISSFLVGIFKNCIFISFGKYDSYSMPFLTVLKFSLFRQF